jgi:hypothetical protein
MFQFELNSQPSAPLTMYLDLEMHKCDGPDANINANKNFRLTVASPYEFYFDSDSESLVGSFTVAGWQGCYTLNAYGISEGQDNYNVTTTEIVIINMFTMTPDIPLIDTVRFSTTGDALEINFDSPTNAPLFDNSTVFACSNIVFFKGSEYCNCKWRDDAVLSASLTSNLLSNDDKPEIGNNVTLFGGLILPKCYESLDCSNYPNMSISTSDILGPLDPIVPSVVFVAPKAVGSCDDIILDPTQSSGHGGRDWFSVLWRVVDSTKRKSDLLPYTNLTQIALIQQFLQAEYASSNSLIRVPNRLITPGYTYSISLTLMNFLGQFAMG